MFLLQNVCAGTAFGGGFWCNGNLVSEGATRYEVLSECGEPDFKDLRFEKRVKRDYYRNLFPRGEWGWYREQEFYREPYLAIEEVVIEEWTYNFGPARFIRYLIFENGRLSQIETGEYGF